MNRPLYSYQEKFFSDLVPHIIRACTEDGLLPSVAIAQCAVETWWGQSIIKGTNNIFNTTAGKSGPNDYWKGDVVIKEDNGHFSKFRVYDNVYHSAKDRNFFLKNFSRYKGFDDSQDPYDQIKKIHEAGFAESRNYADSCSSIIRQYDLVFFDELNAETIKLLPDSEDVINRLIKQKPSVVSLLVIGLGAALDAMKKSLQ